MKNGFILIFLFLLISCSMDNTPYPLQLESIEKTAHEYVITLSTEVNLDKIKRKHHFTEQRMIGLLKKRHPEKGDAKLLGNFDTSYQTKKGNRYYYQCKAKFESKETNLKAFDKNDTLNVYLQLSYDMGRTYPTKSVAIPAKAFH